MTGCPPLGIAEAVQKAIVLRCLDKLRGAAPKSAAPSYLKFRLIPAPLWRNPKPLTFKHSKRARPCRASLSVYGLLRFWRQDLMRLFTSVIASMHRSS
jgi:hypothetical protein